MEIITTTMFFAFITAGISALYLRPRDTAAGSPKASTRDASASRVSSEQGAAESDVNDASATEPVTTRISGTSLPREKSATPEARPERRSEKSTSREASVAKGASAKKSQSRSEKSAARAEGPQSPKAKSTPRAEKSAPREASVPKEKSTPRATERSASRAKSTPRRQSTPRVSKSLPVVPAVMEEPTVADKENVAMSLDSPSKAKSPIGHQIRATPLNLKKLDNDDTAFNESQARRKAMLARIQNTLADVSKTHNRVYGEVAEIRRSYACTATMSHVGSDDDEDDRGNSSFASAPAVRQSAK